MKEDLFSWSRRPGEMTTEYLGRVLDDLDLREMAGRARCGEFDDFQCPNHLPWVGMELHRLVFELDEAARSPRCGAARRAKIRAVIGRVKTGEFDATTEESARWAASKAGQDACRRVLGGLLG